MFVLLSKIKEFSALLKFGIINISKPKISDMENKIVIAVIFFFFPVGFFTSNLKEFNAPIGGYTTPIYHFSDDIIHNIKLSASKINKTILEKGMLFSFNKIVGDRTSKGGYRQAPVIFNSNRVELPGGGICVVSSTVYAATLTGNLKVLERHKHLMPVSYIPIGLDATVSWGYKDLKFKNNLGQKIQITAEIIGGRLVISLWGEKSVNVRYEIISEINEIPPSESNPQLLPALEAKAYRLKYIEDKLIEKQFLHRDYYPPRLK